MDSENDFHGAYDDFDSLKEYYSDGDNAIDYGDDSGADDDVDADHDGTIDDSDDMPDDDDCDNKRDQKQRNYTILTEEDIRRRQEDDTTRISTVLSVSKQWATLLLCNFQWSVSRVHDEWFADEDRVCRAVGLYAEKSVAAGKRLECGICFENCLSETTHSAAGCGHRYCENCWEGYIGTSINDGPGCLFLQCPCPDPFCNAAIDQSMIDKLASDEDKKKYSRYLFRSYIEGHRKTKWCPAPGCDFAVEFSADGDGNCDVSCLCSHGFCWNCSEESHSPVDCGTVSKWLIKNSSESENMNWILANSKACPKCKRQIEKNHGCMHMTCSPPCKFEFCWLCLGPWSQHGQTTGGFYACNIYAVARKQGTLDNEAETRREMAKQSLERYMHYYERWQTNQSSMKKALADLHEAQTNQIPKLSDTLPATNLQLMFITDAWLQIIECRRVLKWTYAYGYYIPKHEHAKKEFFEYAQGLAESALEKLHNCAETDVKDFLGYEGSSEGFNDFRNKLRELTSVTKTYFSNLVSALENGLSDVYHGAYKKTARSKHSGKAKKVKT